MEKLQKLILEAYGNGKVALFTCEGIVTCDMEEFISQHVDGLLYDLNHLECTTMTLAEKDDPRWINDLAVAKVIRTLKEKLDKYKQIYASNQSKQEIPPSSHAG